MFELEESILADFWMHLVHTVGIGSYCLWSIGTSNGTSKKLHAESFIFNLFVIKKKLIF